MVVLAIRWKLRIIQRKDQGFEERESVLVQAGSLGGRLEREESIRHRKS